MKRLIKNIIWRVMYRIASWIAEDEAVVEQLDDSEQFYHE